MFFRLLMLFTNFTKRAAFGLRNRRRFCTHDSYSRRDISTAGSAFCRVMTVMSRSLATRYGCVARLLRASE